MLFLFPYAFTRLGVLSLAAAAVLCGCAAVSDVPRVPGFKERAEVVDLVERGDYTHATLRFDDRVQGLFLPHADAVCQRLIVRGGQVEFQRLGRLGRVIDGAETCDPLGTSSLRLWRDRQPRAPRADRNRVPARFREVHADADLLMIRGRLPLVGYLGFAPDDSVVIVPANDACRAIVDRGEALMEYRAKGDEVLTLLGGENRCPVVGVAVPVRR